MLTAGEPPVLGSSGDVAAPASSPATMDACEGATAGGGGGAGSNSGEDEKARGDEGDRSFCGNRWPRQETLALLKIRSDMDQVFRDSSHKGPLWEEVARKLAELGFHRSAKKCKEKFENVYKYHKRTKDGRTGKPEGKHYKFFDQLQALDQPHSSPSKPLTTMQPPKTTMPWTNPPTISAHFNNMVLPSPSTLNVSATPPPPPTNPTISTAPSARAMSNNNSYPNAIPTSFPNISNNLFSSSTSSSTASDEEYEGLGKRKRKWRDFFKRLTKEVIRKQEELQDKFLEAIEKREHERVVREESWRIQEMARINREHQILIQERSTAAAKDAAVIAFLQKISGQQLNPVQTRENPQPPAATLEIATRPQPPPPPPPMMAISFGANNGETPVMPSSSRWPKAEVQALIKFRTELSHKYQENGPKGPLWEEISAAMRSIGYNRSAKRCKEKWENINKYFKKVKESNKKRSEDSRTCPYYDQLDALYKEKNKNNDKPPLNSMVPLMVQPEQQWPLQPHSVIEQMERDNGDQIHDDEDEEEEDGETEDEYEGGGYEIAANKQQQQPSPAAAPMGTAERETRQNLT